MSGTPVVSHLHGLLPIMIFIALLGTGVPSGAGADVLVPLPSGAPFTLPDGEDLEAAPRIEPYVAPIGNVDSVPVPAEDSIRARRLFLPLHRAATTGDQQRLFEGQETVRHFTLTLPVEAVVADAEFVLSYLSSVQLLPSASRLEVFLNGSEILSLHPDAFSSPSTMRAQVSDELLRPGRNEVQ